MAVLLRRRVLRHSGGAVDCSLRVAGTSTWMPGVGRYDGDALRWYRVASFATRPRHVFSRGLLRVVDRRGPSQDESPRLPPDPVILSCVHNGQTVELAFSEFALTGFLAWLEASPPGLYGGGWS